MSEKLTCIVCPRGCRLEVTETAAGGCLVAGQGCERGKEYAEREMAGPVRILTTTVKVTNGVAKRLPVKTDQPIPKAMLAAVMAVIRQQAVTAPVKAGDVVFSHVFSTRCNIVATKSVPAVTANRGDRLF